MRTKALLGAALILAAGVATSMAQNVYSLNVVGYVSKVCPQGAKLVCLVNPLNTTNNTIGGVINTSTVPPGSVIFKWNSGSQSFNTYTRAPSPSGYTSPSALTVSLNPGEGFFLKSPVGSVIDVTNTFIGEVLQSFSANTPASISNYLAPGLWLTGSMIPVSNTVSQLQLTIPFSSSPVNQIFRWNVAGQGYSISTRTPAAWNTAEPAVDVAEGFFTKLAAAQSWLQNFTVQ